ncbi:hypothetical protein ANN_03810 [Periplaneta americana]|uniref:Uncharacterized protein n=1 Tax=Periplaneta americana TaxID=6978 RepID=A0ABQ8U012_PERAM|nr:hypothetical protein ANN_03810 [Periplaneta americana]
MAGLCEGGNEPPGSLKANTMDMELEDEDVGGETTTPVLHLLAGYTKWDHKRNEDVMEELQLEPVINHVKNYRNNWINHLHRMHRDRIPKVMLHYRPNGKRSLGCPKKRWIENSTSTVRTQIRTSLVAPMWHHYEATKPGDDEIW